MKKIVHTNHRIDIDSTAKLATILDVDKEELFSIPQNVSVLYHKIPLKKKDGSIREINAPENKLKEIQHKILYKILAVNKLLPCVYGCGIGKSIIENAKKHSKGKYMVNFDIKDFFPSVHYKRIVQLYIDIGCSNSVAEVLCRLSTLDYCLPQGAPTSPYLSSLALHNLDTRLFQIAKINRITYTRYFDDISISGSDRVIEIKETIEKIIRSEGYQLKIAKTKIYKPNEDKEITGLIIKPDGSLDIKWKEETMKYCNKLKQFGLAKLKSSLIEKEKQSLYGKIVFICSVDVKYSKILYDIFKQIDWH